MPLKLTKRGEIWYVRGTVRGIRCYETCGTSDPKRAEAFRAKREAELYDQAVFGARAVVSFAHAALSYLEFETRGDDTKFYVGRLVKHFGNTALGKIDQTAAEGAVKAIVGDDAAPATKIRGVYTPLTAILSHAAARGWCPLPKFERPKLPKGKTRWLTPAEALALVEGAAPHLRPLLLFILCTGARLSEALDLDWNDVDLPAGKVIFRDTKGQVGQEKDRVAMLTPAAVALLANLPGEEIAPGEWVKRGKVFRRDDGEPYEDRERLEGGQIKTAWRTACKRAGIVRPVLGEDGKPKLDAHQKPIVEPTATPHDLRHTWATYFYALTKDMLLLKDEGGWASIKMVERYAHLMPSALVGEIWRVWGTSHPRIGALPGVPNAAQRETA